MPGPVGKAMVLHEHGADKLTLVEDFQFAEPKAGEVLVKVVAAGVNPVDGECAQARARVSVLALGARASPLALRR